MTEKIEFKIDINAPASKVFEALTEAGKLEQWFAEKAYVSQSKKQYDFWGRYTPEAPGPESGRNHLLTYEPHTKLGFNWRVRGEETQVNIALEETTGGTSVRLEHEAPARPHTHLSLGDFWMLSFENLRRFLKDGSAPIRCDYSSPPRGDVELAVEIGATPEDVYRGLTRPEEVNRWIADKADIEPVVGGRYSFGWEWGPVKILDLVPNEKLVHSWTEPDMPETVVTWTLEGSGGKTRLLLVHSGFAPDRETEDLRTGWMKHVIWLKVMLEQGESWQAPGVITMDHEAV